MRAVNRLMALLFVFSALVQWNDPDGWVWVAIYALPVGMCVGWERGRFSPRMATVVAGSAAVGAFWSWYSVSGENGAGMGSVQWRMVDPQTEHLREAGGLLLVSVWTAVLAKAWSKSDAG